MTKIIHDADAYRAAARDEAAADRAMTVTLRAANALGDLVQRADVSPELHEQLGAVWRAVRAQAVLSMQLWHAAKADADRIAAAAVASIEAAIESDGTCYAGDDWADETDIEPSAYDVEAAE